MGFETSGFFSRVTVAQLNIADDPPPTAQDPSKDRETNASTRPTATKYTPVQVPPLEELMDIFTVSLAEAD